MNTFTRRDFIKQTAVVTGGIGCAAVGGEVRAADHPEISPDALAQLKMKLKGWLVLPSDSTYESARRGFYWNPKTERKPLAVVQCGHEEDAVRAGDFARRYELEVAVRSGGHSHLGWGS